ncbi:MAG: DNA primase [Microscillaceae bacterium]|nr:DNA primase [Microscillaceae bacterium]MDW8461513.1 DNA primase [Cytophagales bacterium]
MKILPQSIEKVRKAADIVEVISEYISLKRAGKDYKALCPFHNERTPSFTVSSSEQFYYCFGCNASGNVISFVQNIENLTFVQAVEKLAQRYQIELEYEEKPPQEQKALNQEKEKILALLKYAKDFFVNNLYNTQEGNVIALSYLQERGFLPSTIEQFELGYSLESWDALLQNALRMGFDIQLLLKANLISQNEQGKLFDRFRERIMFPIHNFTGQVVAFGARTLNNNKQIAKYINSSEIVLKNEKGETEYEIYVKSKILYGLFQAKKSIKQKDKCLLVEGYADVISLHQAGLTYAVASLGTALSIEQIQLIKRLTQNVILLYDGDRAGVKAALRGLELIITQGLNLQLVILPDQEDPDSYLKKYGGIQLEAYIAQNAKDFVDFIQGLYAQTEHNDFQQYSQVIRQVAYILTLIPDEIVRQRYLQKAQLVFGQDAQALTTEYNKLLLKKQDESLKQAIKDALAIDNLYQVRSFLEQKASLLGVSAKTLFFKYKHAKLPLIAQLGLSKNLQERTRFYQTEAAKFKILGIEVTAQQIQQSLSSNTETQLDEALLAELQNIAETSETEDFQPLSPYEPVYKQEAICLKYLFQYGQQKVHPEENMLVYEYILEETSDIQFSHPIFKQIIAACRMAWAEENILTSEFFLNHPEESLQKAVRHLLLAPYSLSPRWASDFNLNPEQDNPTWVFDAVYENILRLKQFKIEQMIYEQEQLLAHALTPEEQDSLLLQIMQLQKIQQQIAHELRIVIKPKRL